MQFLMAAMSPMAAPKDQAKLTAPRTLDQVFEYTAGQASHVVSGRKGFIVCLRVLGKCGVRGYACVLVWFQGVGCPGAMWGESSVAIGGVP
jgi:hypothetical protein